MENASVGIIVGCVVGGLVVFAAIMVFIVWCFLRCKEKNFDDLGSMKSKVSGISGHGEIYNAGTDDRIDYGARSKPSDFGFSQVSGVSNGAYVIATTASSNDLRTSDNRRDEAVGRQLSVSAATPVADFFHSEPSAIRMSHRNRMSRTSAEVIAVRKDYATGIHILPTRSQSTTSDDVCIVYDERTAL